MIVFGKAASIFTDPKEQENYFCFLCASEDIGEPHSFSFIVSFKYEKLQPLAEQVSPLVPNKVVFSCLLILPRGVPANTKYCILNIFPFADSIFNFLGGSSLKF